MFDFLSMLNNGNERCVARYEEAGLIVDTSLVIDGEKPYETGVAHHEYNNGDWVIVENYDTKEQAITGHEKWVRIMTGESLPSFLTDCQNSVWSVPGPFPRTIDITAKDTNPLLNGGENAN